ncbi:MAG: multidrug efflux RND transporter permease subunit [Candidatus Omnitrophica bacterium]|nr:multidrug efflux RND transporter permease subunit [Candidatus Omnitrophota bacterium]
MFSHFFIHRPVFAGVISIIIVILGGIAMIVLPIARYPQIAPPTIQVSTLYPGANAETVANTVATPLEQEINGVEGMLYMSSTSSNDGSLNITITFEVGTNLDMANVLVQNRVSLAENRLPEEVKRQGVSVKKQSTEITILASVYSPDGEFDELFLSNYATLYIQDELRRVPGVGAVTVFGAGDYGMRIWLDPAKLKARSLTTQDVILAIREQNVEVAAGQIGEPPAPEGQAFQYTINTRGRLSDPEEFGAIIIRSGEDGALVRVRDVARVELGSRSYSTRSQLNGAPCAAIAVYQLPGANAIDVVNGVEDRLEALAKRFPPGLQLLIPFDSTEVIRESIREVALTLFMTLGLVVFTVYIFLQNFRATLIPSLTIPVSLIGTFTVMHLLGFSINQLTLFGLVLVIGIVVDDAIVVVENVTRHLDEGGMSAKKATETAMTEVTGPIVATTLVLLAVFVPTAFLGGITGQLFQQFALTISIATTFSAINALTLSPALCGFLLKPTPERKNPIFRGFDWLLLKGTNAYEKTVKFFLRIFVLGLALYLLVLGLAVFGFERLPTGFVPQEDEGFCVINFQLPDGASFERTQEVVNEVNRMLQEEEGVANAIMVTGFSFLNGARASNQASGFVIFDNWSERLGKGLTQERILGSINMKLNSVQEAIAMAFVTPSLPGLGVAGGFAFQVQDLGGSGLANLQNAASDMVDAGNSQSAIGRMYSSFRAGVPQLFLNIDRDQVKEMKVSLGEVFNTLQAYLGSMYVNDFNKFGRIYQVMVQADSEYRAEIEDIRSLEVRNAMGEMVPLGAVVEVEEILGPQTITHYNIYPSAKIMGSAAPGVSSGRAMELVEQMAQKTLPQSMGFEWTDISYQQKVSAGSAGPIFALSILLVYLMLAAQYESWSLPISVVMAVPTALFGAVGGVLLRGMDNNVYTQIGIVLLIGLSTKTAILIVEFAKVQHEEGKSVFDAAVIGARLRFRAVLMTAFSFILGVIPLVVASGAGAESRQVLGTSVFGGMLFATGLSVALIPMWYYLIQRVTEWFFPPKNRPD